MKRHDFECIQRIKESEASVDCRGSLDELEAHLAIDGSCTNELFGTPEIQGESRDATDAGGNALDTLNTDYLKKDPEPAESAQDEDGNECAAAE